MAKMNVVLRIMAIGIDGTEEEKINKRIEMASTIIDNVDAFNNDSAKEIFVAGEEITFFITGKRKEIGGKLQMLENMRNLSISVEPNCVLNMLHIDAMWQKIALTTLGICALVILAVGVMGLCEEYINVRVSSRDAKVEIEQSLDRAQTAIITSTNSATNAIRDAKLAVVAPATPKQPEIGVMKIAEKSKPEATNVTKKVQKVKKIK